MSTDSEVVVKKKTEIKEPRKPGKANVVLLNDDQTPMEFVVALLIQLFKHNQASALDLTMKIHQEGRAVAGTYTYEIAEQKAEDSNKLARANNFPLVTKVEGE
jgi:ATP-dependent Clp protease adaptor protein ClpS